MNITDKTKVKVHAIIKSSNDLSKDIKQNENIRRRGSCPAMQRGGGGGEGAAGSEPGTSPRGRPTYQPRLLAVRHGNALDCGPRIPWRNQIQKMGLLDMMLM
jgi:hypothetical protein